MKLQILVITILLASTIFAVSSMTPLVLKVEASSSAASGLPHPTLTPHPDLTDNEKKIEIRDSSELGIRVDTPEVFDDASLQQMLQEAEIKLASLQGFDQSALKAGAISGATQQTSSFALSLSGPSLPGITTTNKGATGSTVETDKTVVNPTGATTETSVQTTSGLPSQDVQTTRAQVNPLLISAPAASTSLPSNSTVAASSNLNEEAQLSAQIQMLRLLLRGSLSSQFIKPGSDGTGQMTKLKTTLGFPISVSSNAGYKNAVAVVEVEVDKGQDLGGATFNCTDIGNGQNLGCDIGGGIILQCRKNATRSVLGSYACSTPAEAFKCTTAPGNATKSVCQTSSGGGEPPMITTLLPQEKTYNVAAITDKNISVGGGIVTQVLGASGSWLWGRKTYYVRQDQDTVALTFQPEGDPNKTIGFMWQFRPVLGGSYVQTERKYVFVQLAFPAPLNARPGDIGKVRVRTYWRKYDPRKGVVGGIIPHSLKNNVLNWDIPNFAENASPLVFDQTSLEDIGGGKMFVNILGRFMLGTYVRIGDTPVPSKTDYYSIRFTAATSDLINKKVRLVSPDGREIPLEIKHMRNKIAIAAFKELKTIDDANSAVTVELPDPQDLCGEVPLSMVIGGRVFGFTTNRMIVCKYIAGDNSPIQITAIVPTSLLVENKKIILTSYFAPEDWKQEVAITDYDPATRTDRLAVFEKGPDFFRFLLFGNRLANVKTVNPTGGVTIEPPAGGLGDNGIRVVKIMNTVIQANKFLMLQKGNERPFALTIPSVEIKDKTSEPKPLESVLTNADEAIIEGVNFNDIASITYKGTPLVFVDSADIPGIVVTELRDKNVTTGTASIRPLVFAFKSGAKVVVKLQVVGSKAETIPK